MKKSNDDKFLRRWDVEKITGLSESTIYRLERQGQFPHRRKIAPRNVGWLNSEIQSWINNKPPMTQG